MQVEIPDDKLPKIMKGVQDLYNSYLEDEDPAPGIGKTSNKALWFQELNIALNDQFKNEVKLVFDGAIDKVITACFSKIQKSFDITSGDEPFDSKINTLRNELAKECARIVMFQMC